MAVRDKAPQVLVFEDEHVGGESGTADAPFQTDGQDDAVATGSRQLMGEAAAKGRWKVDTRAVGPAVLEATWGDNSAIADRVGADEKEYGAEGLAFLQQLGLGPGQAKRWLRSYEGKNARCFQFPADAVTIVGPTGAKATLEPETLWTLLSIVAVHVDIAATVPKGTWIEPGEQTEAFFKSFVLDIGPNPEPMAPISGEFLYALWDAALSSRSIEIGPEQLDASIAATVARQAAQPSRVKALGGDDASGIVGRFTTA